MTCITILPVKSLSMNQISGNIRNETVKFHLSYSIVLSNNWWLKQKERRKGKTRLDILLGFAYKGSSGWARSFIFITQNLPLTSVPFSLHLMLVVGVVKFPEDVSALFPFLCPFKHKGDAYGHEVETRRRSVVVFLCQDPESTNRLYYPCPPPPGASPTLPMAQVPIPALLSTISSCHSPWGSSWPALLQYFIIFFVSLEYAYFKYLEFYERVIAYKRV